MSTPIEDYAILADLRTAPLISREGSMDWLCLPRFDSPAVFASLLGRPEHGCWRVSVAGGTVTERAYRGGSFTLDTQWSAPDGAATVTDFMPISGVRADVSRIVRCTEGTVEVEAELIFRFNYGSSRPWVRGAVDPDGEYVLHALAGPDALVLHGPRLTACDGAHRGRFTLHAGQELAWVLTWTDSYRPIPARLDVAKAERHSLRFWSDWHDDLTVDGPYAGPVRRSLGVLRALTDKDTGGIVAAATTSLPEALGGERNWDYRFCWLRDSALTIEALLSLGHRKAAVHWRDWLLRAIAGDPEDLQIMYGIAGERQLPETELDHLPGYADSRPVRIGNGAVDQYQADVLGAVLISLRQLRDAGVAEDKFSWGLQQALIRQVEANIDRPDQGIWEMRGTPRFFTHGQVMNWAAVDCGIQGVEKYGLPGPVEHWRELRERLRAEIEERGVDAETGGFVQCYGGREADASLLQLPHTGFVAWDDPRMLATVAHIEQELRDEHGFLLRYRTDTDGEGDGLSGDEGAFLICTFWLVAQYAHSGRRDDAVELMDKLMACANDVGLLSEEYDAGQGRQLGNFPQAFSHLGLIRAARALTRPRG